MCVQFKKTNCMCMFPLIRKSKVDFLLFMLSGPIIDSEQLPDHRYVELHLWHSYMQKV